MNMLNPWSGSFLDPAPWMANPFAFCMPAPASAPAFGSAPLAAPLRAAKRAGTFSRCHIATPFGSLAYKLFIPHAYCGEPLPLLMMLHGCGQDADDFARGTAMNALADEFDCIVVYPEQANSNRCWNWFDDAHHHRDQGEPALLASIAYQIMDEYAVDARKVFVAGLSAGGAMAVVLGHTYPELFSAVGCHSGLAYACATDMSAALDAMRDGPGHVSPRRDSPRHDSPRHDSPRRDSPRHASPGHAQAAGGRAVPVIVFHGDVDGMVHPRNGSSVIEQSVVACELAQAPAQAFRGESTGRAFTRHVFQTECGQVLAEQWVVHGAGHAWSGGHRSGSYTDAYGPNASAEMLRFFLSRRAQ